MAAKRSKKRLFNPFDERKASGAAATASSAAGSIANSSITPVGVAGTAVTTIASKTTSIAPSGAASHNQQGTPASTSATGTSASASSRRLPPVSSGTNKILVNIRQKGNPVLKHIRNVPWEYSDAIIADFQLGQSTCALYMSLRYYNLHNEYIYSRIREMKSQQFRLRVLLIQVDVKDYSPLSVLAKLCVMHDMTMIVAWTMEEAGRYLETYKQYEHKSYEQLQEKVSDDYVSRLTAALTTVRTVNKTDAMTLLSTFGGFKDIANASADDLRLCPGFGEQKVERLTSVFDEPFVKPGRTDTTKFNNT